MAFFNHISSSPYFDIGGGDFTLVGAADNPNTLTDDGGDNFFTLGETLNNGPATGFATYAGTLTVGPDTFIVAFNGSFHFLFSPDSVAAVTFPTTFNVADLNTAPLLACFLAGTLIATPSGEVAVENLAIGDRVRLVKGRSVAVKWVGRQIVTPATAGPRSVPVRIRAGALGHGLPRTDLMVTADHGMILDGLVINAGALVNGTTIDFVPLADLPASFTVYHVETEAHDVILANGAPAETFIDYVGRSAFDNHAEYLALYGCERIIPEMARPRISTARLLPEAIRARLGIGPCGADDLTILTQSA